MIGGWTPLSYLRRPSRTLVPRHNTTTSIAYIGIRRGHPQVRAPHDSCPALAVLRWPVVAQGGLLAVKKACALGGLSLDAATPVQALPNRDGEKSDVRLIRLPKSAPSMIF